MVSGDSSLFTVKGELEMTIVFPGISCDMLLVVARIGWPAGYGSPAIVLATSAGLANGAIVGGRSIDITVAPTYTCT